ncbi:MAG: hypothetical protein JWO40_540 [Candidatus Doudnabacteria bacterium]|nr:hypothetical protein [Candidatus Doudnabacteria bacterium]
MYSIDDFKKDQDTVWTEVRNYQARNFLRDSISVGDYFFFYHSSSEPSGIAGVGKILRTKIGDPTALDKKSEYFDPKATKEHNPWSTVEVQFVEKFPAVITLAEVKQNKKLSKMVVAQKGSRLSVQPVKADQFEEIMNMAYGH